MGKRVKMRIKGRAITGCALGLACVLAFRGSAHAQVPDRASVAIDRWLVSSAFPVDSPHAGDVLRVDRLDSPGEVAVLPDRGRTVAGADWTLVRRDSLSLLDLEPFREPGARAVVYAHAYIRSPADRTVSLRWAGLECTGVAAWLNGRLLADSAAAGAPRPSESPSGPAPNRERLRRVRIGSGYNTLLLKAAAGDCPFGLSASLEARRPTALEGVRVQASRPFGDTRTGPEPWLLADAEAGPDPLLGWKDDRLFGAARVRLTAFAVTALEGAELAAKVGGEEVRRKVEWLTPGEPAAVPLPFEFERLHRSVVRGEGLELALNWGNGESKEVLRLDSSALLAALSRPVRLLGWRVTGRDSTSRAAADEGMTAESDADDAAHPLAHLIPLPGTGETLVGEWEVPRWMSGFTLALDTRGAAGEYRVDAVAVDGEGTVLCSPCREGEMLQIVVRSTAPWSRFPGARIADGPVPADLGPGEATEWLRGLDGKANRRFRERLAELLASEAAP